LILLFKQMKKLKGHKGIWTSQTINYQHNATLQAINLKLKRQTVP
jgi:hypothetical protein